MTGVALTNKTSRVPVGVCTRAQISLNFACWGSYSIHFRYFNWEAAACQTGLEVRAEIIYVTSTTVSGGKKTFWGKKTHKIDAFNLKSILLTAKASWNSKTSMSFKDNPALSRTFGVLYVGLEKREKNHNNTTFFYWSLWSNINANPSSPNENQHESLHAHPRSSWSLGSWDT